MHLSRIFSYFVIFIGIYLLFKRHYNGSILSVTPKTRNGAKNEMKHTFIQALRSALSVILILSITAVIFTGCGNNPPEVTDKTSGYVTESVTTEAPVTVDPNAPDPAYPEGEYRIIGIDEYKDRTTAGFLSQLVGLVCGYEFATYSSGRCRVAMPDVWFDFLNGPYAGNKEFMFHTDKLIKNKDTGIVEVWIDDDFSVDIFNQYSMEKSYKAYGTVSAKSVSDGWTDYDIWDMGGGQKKVGAYGLISRNGYLPQFAGNTEYGNWYSYCTEAYLGTDTLGMNAAGMPETAVDIAETYALVTGDRDNVEFAKMFAAMISIAYFEDDVTTVIKEAAKVLPEGSWERGLVDELFALYEKYPDNWRDAYKEHENKYFVKGDTRNTNTTINCGFAILDLLYGKGDYMETCRIGSLAGYDCESTCGIALTVLSVMHGMDFLPEKVNEVLWQDGKGVIVNRPLPTMKDDVYMHAAKLAERMTIAEIVDKYVKNFESVLTEHGGHMDERYYYIPAETLGDYTPVIIENCGFEKGTLDGFTVNGDHAEITPLATMGLNAAKLTGDTDLYTTVKGLTVGKTYELTVYIYCTATAEAFIYARTPNGKGVCVTLYRTPGTSAYEAQKTVKRTLLFEATAEEMQIGVQLNSANNKDYAIVDQFKLLEAEIVSVGTAEFKNPTEDNVYTGSVNITITSEVKGVAYLKLNFATAPYAIVDTKLTLNRRPYGTVALYRTSKNPPVDLTPTDYVLIPIVVKEGSNTANFIFEGKKLTFTDVQLIYLNKTK